MRRRDAAMGTEPPADRGMATVWTAGAIAAILAIAGAIFWLGAVLVARQRVEGAADLAALAAAGRANAGTAAACARAELVAVEAGVRVRECRLAQWDALVRLDLDLPAPLGVVSGRARAGPVARSP